MKGRVEEKVRTYEVHCIVRYGGPINLPGVPRCLGLAVRVEASNAYEAATKVRMAVRKDLELQPGDKVEIDLVRPLRQVG